MICFKQLIRRTQLWNPHFKSHTLGSRTVALVVMAGLALVLFAHTGFAKDVHNVSSRIQASSLDSQEVTLESLGLTAAEQQWIAAHKTIKIGIDGGYAPYSYVDQKGAFIGIVPDFLARISAITGLKFEAIPNLTWPDIIESSQRHTLDVVATAVKTPKRDGFLNFTQIYIPTPLMVTARKEDMRFLSTADLDGKMIALVEGYSSSQRVLKEHPNILPRFVETPLEGLRMVASGDADGYVGVLGVNVHLAIKHGLANLKQAIRYDLITNGQRFGVRKDWPELSSILDKALDHLSNREKNAILANWVPVSMDNFYLPVFDLTFEEQAWLKVHPNINVGIMNAWPPMDYVDDMGKPQGIGAGFIKALNLRLGGALNVKPGSWDKILQDAKDKRLDVIMDITPRQEREAFFNFTTPYVKVPHVIFARDDSPNYESLKDLHGLTIGVERSFFVSDVIRKDHPDIKLIEFSSTSDALDALTKGMVDAYVGNRAVTMYIIRNELIPNVREYGKIEETSSINAIGVRKDWPILHGILHKALSSISEKERHSILKDWVSSNIQTDPFSLNLNGEEWAWLAKHPVIRVAGDRNWPPVEYLGKNGKNQGLSVDYLNRISEMLGVRFDFDKGGDWNTILRKLQERDLDLLLAIAPTEDRREFASFTTPYLKLPAIIFSNENITYIDGIAGLKNKSVAVVRGYATSDYLRERNKNLTLVKVKDVKAGLNKLKNGEVDAYVGSLLATSYVIRKFGFDSIRAVGQLPFQINISMAARSDWPIFHSILQKALRNITDDEKTAFEAQRIGVQVSVEPDYAFFWKLVGILGLTLVIAFSFVVILKRQVSLKTLALRRNEKMLLTLINVNETLLGAENEEELLNKICLNLIEQGGFKLAWVGFAELNDAKSVKVVAEHGFESGYLEGLKIQWDDSTHGQGPTGTAIKTGQPSIVHDILNDPLYEPWREQALSRGFEASIALPLITEGQVTGALNLYSEDPFVFDEEMVKLLVEMANDLAFGLRIIRDTKLHFEMEGRLRQSEKMDAIGNLAGGIAHDLKNMLFPVLTLTEMIIKDFPKDSRTYQRLEKVLEGGSRARELVEKIHSLSHVDTTEREEVDLKDAMHTTLGLLHSSIPSTIKIIEDFPENQSFIANIEIAQLQTALMNLASNASDSMENHTGELHLKLSHITIDDFKLKDISVPIKGNYIKLSVRDTGHGMNEETLKKLFQPYFTTKERGEGTGLGMPMVQKFVTEHGGEINISSEVGVGTTVEIYLPLVEKKE